jgi:hypothetical protein
MKLVLFTKANGYNPLSYISCYAVASSLKLNLFFEEIFVSEIDAKSFL